MLVAVTTFAGCASTPASRIRYNRQLFASFAPKDQQLIQQGQIAIGFMPDMVRLALGDPDIVAQRIDASGSTEIWRYQRADFNNRAVVYSTWGGGPFFGPRWGGYWGGGWGPNVFWDSQPVRTDFLRVTFRNERVVEINRLR